MHTKQSVTCVDYWASVQLFDVKDPDFQAVLWGIRIYIDQNKISLHIYSLSKGI